MFHRRKVLQRMLTQKSFMGNFHRPTISKNRIIEEVYGSILKMSFTKVSIGQVFIRRKCRGRKFPPKNYIFKISLNVYICIDQCNKPFNGLRTANCIYLMGYK